MTYFVVANVYTWWRGDDLPALPPLPDFRCQRVDDVQLLAGLRNVGPQAIETRLATENNAYVAFGCIQNGLILGLGGQGLLASIALVVAVLDSLDKVNDLVSC